MCRNRSYDCQQLAERAPNARVRDVLVDIARTWTRLALEVEELRRENSPRNRLAKRDPANATVCAVLIAYRHRPMTRSDRVAT